MEIRDKIIVIGGGFAGLQFAKKLNGNRTKKLVMIDKANHHMFQPLFYQVACGRIEPSNISFPFRKIFQRSKNIQFRMTEVKQIIPSENKIITATKSTNEDNDGLITIEERYFFNGLPDEIAEQGIIETQRREVTDLEKPNNLNINYGMDFS